MRPEKDNKSTRRSFLTRHAGAAAVTATLLTGSRASARSVLGANDRINIAFIGNGMQFLSLIRGFANRKQTKNDVHFSAVCDVWQPRLENALKISGADKAYRDYREVLARPDIDGVVLAVPDHWHHDMAKEAMLAGKDVYLEKPMTITIADAADLYETVNRTKRIMQLGGTGPATRLYWKVNDFIKAGKIGKVVWGLISYNRNTREGMWDYPIPGIGEEPWPDAPVTPENLDWKMWLGPAPKRPFSKERYFRWRKFWDYSTGNAGDLLYHRLGQMCTMVGFEFPIRAVAAGGIYVQKNREVPDVYMTMIDYPGEYSINMVSCMANQTSVPVTVYGNWGTIQVMEGQAAVSTMGDQRNVPQQQGQRRPRSVAVARAERQFEKEFREANEGKTEVIIESEPGPSLIENWLDCMRTRESPLYNALRGYQVMVGIGLGVESYRKGKVVAFDPVRQRVLSSPPPPKEYPPREA
ncbi:MAG TPA: Gfo/Idh/MocA family oxidoreductase [Bryobacteraceae bacterium]|nr:Gfo/Idh/MocA family oxidoreductase [Bryobacteraceae bacterium]HOL73342.1 Gfo/Idh/MocA family oxidoreductase [Bryobacteraceae bacterium]HOQ46514.1 Gfo/Idh/MocA family oxidoreductase [Bryobacteraceae bacterium]HPQ16684.1 Gfo/Idh/MocA family oxidoreductase [Bryobacteraceae bacterium]HPU72672.1 Gfo/Idh/MocA family oxidoreductase [Bryobacteraceae bacterium]